MSGWTRRSADSKVGDLGRRHACSGCRHPEVARTGNWIHDLSLPTSSKAIVIREYL
jgi:hypothetical protein